MKEINLSFKLTSDEINTLKLFEKENKLYESRLSNEKNEILNNLYNKGLVSRYIANYLEDYCYYLIMKEEILNQLK